MTALHRFLLWLLAVALVFATVAIAAYQSELRGERRLARQKSVGLTELIADIVEREMLRVRADAAYLAEMASLREYLKGAEGAERRLEDEFRSYSLHQRVYDQIRLIGPNGRERIRINDVEDAPYDVPDEDLQQKGARDYVVRGAWLAQGEVLVTDFDLNVELGRIEWPLKPVIRIVTPLFDGDQRRGLLVLNYRGAALLSKVAEVSHEFDGSLQIVDGSGGYLFHQRRPERAWQHLLGKSDPEFARQYPAAWRELRSASDGTLRDADGLLTYRWVDLAGIDDRHDGDIVILARLSAAEVSAGANRLRFRILLVYAGLAPFVLGLLALLARAGATRSRHEQLIERSERRLRRLSTELIDAQESERSRISRDLHDDLGQLVTSVALDLDRAAESSDDAKRGPLIDRARAANRMLLDRVRGISASLRPAILDDLGLPDALRELAREWSRSSGIPVEFDLRLDERRARGVGDPLYRIAQEALTNVARHAKASRVRLSLVERAGEVEMQVRDDGRGFDTDLDETAGLGLLGMQERAELAGGAFELRSTPEVGTSIRVVIPTGEAR